MYSSIKTQEVPFISDAKTDSGPRIWKTGYRPFTKRLFDLLFCFLLIPVALPVLLFLIVIIKLDSKGPGIYKSRRIGKDGQVFNCYKLRSMCQNAEEVMDTILSQDKGLKEEYLKFRKLKGDPRVTRVGKFLRASSLDELPQIINVLKGEMSFVGPRPIVEDEIQKYGERFSIYKSLKPGITGLWQINGRNETSFSGRVQMDTSYFKNVGLVNDIKILIKTIPVVISKKGAY